MDDPGVRDTVKTFRERVDEVDHELVRLLNERAQLVQEMGSYKQEAGIPLFDPRREEEILSKVAEENPGPIFDSSMRDIFELIMHRIRDIEIQRSEFSDQ
jgi:3-deoxy-7-phosphoheptulonate synthase/chorismate mutase